MSPLWDNNSCPKTWAEAKYGEVIMGPWATVDLTGWIILPSSGKKKKVCFVYIYIFFFLCSGLYGCVLLSPYRRLFNMLGDRSSNRQHSSSQRINKDPELEQVLVSMLFCLPQMCPQTDSVQWIQQPSATLLNNMVLLFRTFPKLWFA